MPANGLRRVREKKTVQTNDLVDAFVREHYRLNIYYMQTRVHRTKRMRAERVREPVDKNISLARTF